MAATATASLLQPRLAQLNADYARALDDDRLEDWPGFFGDPCLYVITTADNHRHGHAAGVIYADSPGMLHDRVAALREANVYERHTYRHLVGLPAIVGESDGLVRAETPFLVVRIMREAQRGQENWRARTGPVAPLIPCSAIRSGSTISSG